MRPESNIINTSAPALACISNFKVTKSVSVSINSINHLFAPQGPF